MDYIKINAITKDLDEYIYNNRNNVVSTDTEKEIQGEGEQGEEGVRFEVFKVDGLEGATHVKIRITTDSYGDNEKAVGAEFVSAKEKTVLVYE